MVLVRGNDAWTGVRISEQVAWGTQRDNTGTWHTVPLVSESLVLNREFTQAPREFGALGYREYVESGRSFVQGSMTVLGRYDAKWFHLLLAHATWRENITVNKWVDGSATDGVGNIHAYNFYATPPSGLNIRVYKSGPNSSGTFESFIGCMITGFTVEQPENEACRFTFNFVGKSVAQSPYAMDAWLAVSGANPIKVRDNANTGAQLRTGTDVTTSGSQMNFRSWRITVDRHVEFDSTFLNDPDNLAQPGVGDIRDVTAELTGFVEQDFYTRATYNTPYKEYLANTQNKVNLILSSAVLCGGAGKSYAMRFEFPAVVWEKADVSIKSGGPNEASYAFRALKGTLDTGSGGGIVPTGPPADWTTQSDMRILGAVANTDEPSVDGYFSALHL